MSGGYNRLSGRPARGRHAVTPSGLRCSGNLRYVASYSTSLFVRVAGMPNGSGRMERAARQQIM